MDLAFLSSKLVARVMVNSGKQGGSLTATLQKAKQGSWGRIQLVEGRDFLPKAKFTPLGNNAVRATALVVSAVSDHTVPDIL
jgi:hypothetical protein